MIRRLSYLLFIYLLLALSASPGLAHSGGLAKDGCHYNRSIGTRHCHRGSSSPRKSTTAPSCRIGMSTQPSKRISHWKRKEGHTKSRILYTGLTYDEASTMERLSAKRLGCYHHLGGPRISGKVWSIYLLE